ncbi:unnamed protein product [Rhizoctonia solani]|uniref:DUF6535 domain-containing protein n=1 Tax=Rhizoctonia solani TaxID=456999 RepID=A0A8H3DA53_9AGAM|nr:unnamed protein product [Rhizoctonia solani]
MIVALITMLVKQWSERYLHGRYFTVGPYYAQARTRQARYNNLDRTVLKMRYVIQALQIMMHTALALFLSGLIVLLKSSNRATWLWFLVLVPTLLAFLFYIWITCMPLFVVFCPYHTPFSSRRYFKKFVALVVRFARMIYRTFEKALEHETGVRALPTSGEEWSKEAAPRDEAEWQTSTSVAPDKLTAQAIVWLISYSQDSSSMDTAIRAIAGTIAGPEFWNDLVQPEPVALVAQRFTSFFQATFGQPNNLVLTLNDSELMQVASCCQGLAKIARHSRVPIVQAYSHSRISRLSKFKSITLPEDQLIAVQRGLLSLTCSINSTIAASGFCGASAWWTSMGRKPYRCTEEYDHLLPYLIAFLRVRSTKITSSLLVALVEALAFEISYMSRELQDEDMANVFHSVVELCSDGSVMLKGPARGMMAATLAVIAMLLNDYPFADPLSSKTEDRLSLFEGKPSLFEDKLSLFENKLSSFRAMPKFFKAVLKFFKAIPRFFTGKLNTSKDKFSISAQHKKTWKIFREKYPLEVDEKSNPRPPHLRQWRASWITDVCTKNPKYLEEHSDALLFLGLGGILCSLRMNSTQFDRVVKLFAEQLRLTPVTQSHTITLPWILSPTSNVKSIIAEGIIAAFRTQPFNPTAQGAFEKTKSELLQALYIHGHWIEFSSDLLVAILQLLESANHGLLQARCLIALDRYWFLHSTSGFNVYNLPSWRLFIDFRLINRWVEIFHHVDNLAQDMPQEERDRLRHCTIACFAKLARTVKIQYKPNSPPTMNHLNPPAAATQPPPQTTTNPPPNPPQQILSSLEQLLLNNTELFEVFAQDIACGANPEVNPADLAFWRHAISCLPSRLAANSTQTSAGHQAPANSVLPSLAASASSQVLPTSSVPQVLNTNTQPPVASGSQPPAANSSLQVPAANTGPPSSPIPSGATTASTSQVPSSSAATSPNTQASTSPSSPAPAPTPQAPPMTRDEARLWLRNFANRHGTSANEMLRKMAEDLIINLNQNP